MAEALSQRDIDSLLAMAGGDHAESITVYRDRPLTWRAVREALQAGMFDGHLDELREIVEDRAGKTWAAQSSIERLLELDARSLRMLMRHADHRVLVKASFAMSAQLIEYIKSQTMTQRARQIFDEDRSCAREDSTSQVVREAAMSLLQLYKQLGERGHVVPIPD